MCIRDRARTIRLLLAEDLLPALALPRGVGDSISTLTYYSIVFLGLLAALAMAGFQVGQLAIVFGALGVGIGLGLQDVVKNFVAGLILMFERPIRLGDVVDVAGMSGKVRDIGMRATIITSFDGAEVVVPNGMLLADKLVNWTLFGSSRRISIDISTGYGVSPQQTIELLVSICLLYTSSLLTCLDPWRWRSGWRAAPLSYANSHHLSVLRLLHPVPGL